MKNEIYEYLITYGFNKENLKKIEEENEDIYFVSLDKVKENIDFFTNKGLNNYEIIENTMYLDFNEKIFDIDNEIILEEVKYTISESVFENYEVKEVVFKVNGEEVYKVS